LHSKILNPYIDFQKTPFVVNQTLRAWDQPIIDGQAIPRIAGVSAFGAGGANAHLVVEEYLAMAEVRKRTIRIPREEFVVPLSARTADQLKQKAIDLLEFMHTAQPEFAEMAYTLQVGREAMEERVGFIARTIDELTDKLQAYINGEQDVENVLQGQMKDNRRLLSLISADADFEETLNKWITGKKLSKVLELWVNGLE
jgi:polyketide synthase PksN